MGELAFRPARRDDLAAIVALLADDAVNGHREIVGEPLQQGYIAAFETISADPNNLLIVGERGGKIIATAQLTFAPNLTQIGATRAIIEGVRVASSERSLGIGEKLIGHLEMLAAKRGCPSVQLTTSHARAGAHRFYARIGYADTHKGFKKTLG